MVHWRSGLFRWYHRLASVASFWCALWQLLSRPSWASLPHRTSLIPSRCRSPCCVGNSFFYAIGAQRRALYQGRALYGPMPVKTETFRELWAPLVHTDFGGNSYGPIIGPYLFLGKFVCTNDPESSSKVSPPTLVLVHGWLFPFYGPVPLYHGAHMDYAINSPRIQGLTLRLKPFHLWGFQLLALIFILSAGFMVFISKNRNLSKGNTPHSTVSKLARVSDPVFWWNHLAMFTLNNSLTITWCNCYELPFVIWPKGATWNSPKLRKIIWPELFDEMHDAKNTWNSDLKIKWWNVTGGDCMVNQNFQRDLGAIGPYEFQGNSYGPMAPLPCFREIRLDQWRWKFVKGFLLDWHWSMDSSSEVLTYLGAAPAKPALNNHFRRTFQGVPRSYYHCYRQDFPEELQGRSS